MLWIGQRAVTIDESPRLNAMNDETAGFDAMALKYAQPKPADTTETRARLADIIFRRSFGRGEITLASGRKSDFYFNLKPTMLDPEGAALLAELTLDALANDNVDYVGGLEMGAVPIAGAIAQLSYHQGQAAAGHLRAQEAEGARRQARGRRSGQGRDARRQARRRRRGRHHHRRLGA